MSSREKALINEVVSLRAQNKRHQDCIRELEDIIAKVKTIMLIGDEDSYFTSHGELEDAEIALRDLFEGRGANLERHKLEGETLRAEVAEDTIDHLRRELALLRRKNFGASHIELEYPGIDGNPDHVTVGLTHVRAADDLFIGYDFKRDGWVIKMRPTYHDEGGIAITDGEPKEVAFVSGWLESDRKRDEEDA